jgi:hypothetical protein
MPRPIHIVVSLGLTLALCACVAGGSTAPEAGERGTALLLPPSFNQYLEASLEARLPNVTRSVGRVLHDAGYRVDVPAEAVVVDAWRLSAKEAGFEAFGGLAGENFERASAQVATRLAENFEFDVLVFTYIEERETQYLGRGARWDGVSRETKIYGEISGQSVDVNNERQRALALSLHILSYSPSGEKLSDDRGGIELVMAFRIDRKEMRWQYFRRHDLLEDTSNLQKAARVALKPFLEL